MDETIPLDWLVISSNMSPLLASGRATVVQFSGILLAGDLLIAAAGLIILCRYVIRSLKGNISNLFSNLPVRRHRMQPELIVIPLAIYGLFLGVCSHGFQAWSAPAWSAPLKDALGGICAHLSGGIACIVVGGLTASAGLRGFLLGPGGWRDRLAWVIGGTLVTFPLCYACAEVVLHLWELWDPTFEPPQHQILELLDQAGQPPWVPAVLWGGAVLVAPMAEEAFFRGICQTGLRALFKRPFWPVAIVAVGFGVVHGAQPQVVLPMIVLGFVLGVAYERSASLVVPMLIHALFNLKTMVYFALLQGWNPV